VASYPCAWSIHKTLTGTTVDTITFSRSHQYIQITNVSGAVVLIVNGGSVASPPADPTGLDTDVAVVPVGGSNVIDLSDEGPWATGNSLAVLKIVGNGNEYIVQAVTGE
jgi:hypothetical protein